MSKPGRAVLIAKLIVLSLLFASLGAGMVGWKVYGRLWLGIGALLAVLVLGALAWYLSRWVEMDELERVRWAVLIGLVALAILSLFWSLSPDGNLKGAALNFGTEMLGAVATYALFELIIERRERHDAREQALEERKAKLVTQMRSDEREIAVTAANELMRLGWLIDGSLIEADLSRACLDQVDLSEADLRQAILTQTQLTEAMMPYTDLRDATLALSNLRGACLIRSDLRGADLRASQLQGAILPKARLDRASLAGASLDDAYLRDASLRNASLTAIDSTFLGGGFAKDVTFNGTDLTRVDFTQAEVNPNQLEQAKTLAGATLPDGTKLSEDNWQAEFEEWRGKQEGREGDESSARTDTGGA